MGSWIGTSIRSNPKSNFGVGFVEMGGKDKGTGIGFDGGTMFCWRFPMLLPKFQIVGVTVA